jgi:hypothetical protein
MKKRNLIFALLLFLDYNGISQQIIKTLADSQMIKVPVPEQFPITIDEVKIGKLPYFKMFRGNIEDKEMTLFIRTSYDSPFRANEGYYYFKDEKKVHRLDGNAFNAYRRNSDKLDNWKMSLCDKFSGMPTLPNTYGSMDRYGFQGWVTKDAFKGILSLPYLTTKKNVPSWYYAESVEGHVAMITIPEISTPFSNFSNRCKFAYSIDGSTLDSLVIHYSVTLPEQLPELKQQLLEKILERQLENHGSIENILKKDVSAFMTENSDIVSVFKTKRNQEYNTILFYYNIELPYYDAHVMCFTSVTSASAKPINSSKYLNKRRDKYLNYDIEAKVFLEVNDVFLTNSRENIATIIDKSKDMKIFKSEEGDLADGIEPLDLNSFILTSTGISFKFPPTYNYYNDIYIFVPYKDLSKYLTPTFKERITRWN